MNIKKTIISFVCLVVTAVSASGQLAVKTNAVMDALAYFRCARIL